ncbi:MAG: hypothetical protein KGQ49_04380 [Verrucomicrobia bacterium]|nr:hypothetical protein [Verrucomicrobiota bacterium]MBU6446614.1 hypothetical protein [Verrucomicrobiota bacterium]MDE3048114.1 hypothetical protein [Verrucomicrobiota bacterium]
MYRVLIVKTSSLGDIIQSFVVLNDLKRRFPTCEIDWAVEAPFAPIVAAHPMVSRVISLEIKQRKHWLRGYRLLRSQKYDVVFDLQANCKSGIITWLSRGAMKVGYGFQSVREWPNIFATHVRFNISKQQNIRLFYLELIERYFDRSLARDMEGVSLHIDRSEKSKIEQILAPLRPGPKLMVCPGSKWSNKQLKESTWIEFLQKIHTFCGANFLLMWGDEREKALCAHLAHHVPNAFVIDKLPLPTWQNLMNAVDLVMAVDSGALHLSATTHTPSFSLFGPTSPQIFKPLGSHHVAIQGACPYGRVFEKQCPVLRSCPTGACIKELKAAELFQAFQSQCAFLRPGSPL